MRGKEDVLIGEHSSLKESRKKSEMTDDERVRNLQRKPYRKAKEEREQVVQWAFQPNAYYIWIDKGLVDPMGHCRAETPKA